MKKINSIIIVFLLIFCVTSAHSVANLTHCDVDTIQNDSDCWDMAIEVYNIYEDVGYDREKCIDIAVFTYDLCLDLEEEGLNEL